MLVSTAPAGMPWLWPLDHTFRAASRRTASKPRGRRPCRRSRKVGTAIKRNGQTGRAALNADNPMTTIKTDFAYRIDRWDPSGNVVQRVADVDDLAVAVETYEAACKRWPGNCLTLRQLPV